VAIGYAFCVCLGIYQKATNQYEPPSFIGKGKEKGAFFSMLDEIEEIKKTYLTRGASKETKEEETKEEETKEEK